MQQFTLNLDKKQQRPCIPLSAGKAFCNTEIDFPFTALLDTGASCPVWLKDEKILQRLGAELVQENVTFGGFGGKDVGNLYKIKNFRLGKLIYTELSIITCSTLKDSANTMVLSATMFSDLIYEIDDKNKKLNVTVPNGESIVRKFTVTWKNGNLYVLCTSDTMNLFREKEE